MLNPRKYSALLSRRLLAGLTAQTLEEDHEGVEEDQLLGVVHFGPVTFHSA